MKNPDALVHNIEPLTTTTWTQNYPYNYQISLLPGSTMQTPVGCVGVAGGQIMAFHKHPETAKGVISDSGITLDIDGFKYDWDNMKDSINSSSEQQSIDAVSTLLLHQNITAKTSGAAGKTDKLFEAFVENFSYNKHIGYVDLKYMEKNYFSYTELQDLVKSELVAGRPVQISVPGHAVVCDGFREDGFFSFNWGWGGHQVWHKLDDSKDGCNPTQAYLNIRPDYQQEIELINTSVDSITLKPLDKYQVKFSMKNICGTEVSGKCRLCLYDKNKVSRNILTSSIAVNFNHNETRDFVVDFQVPDKATFGERILVVEWESASLKWGPVSDANDEISINPVILERAKSYDLNIQHTNLPSSVTEGELADIEVHIASKTECTGKIKLLLVDDNNNSYNCIGAIDVALKPNVTNSVLIPVSFVDIKPQRTHKLMFVWSDVSGLHVQSDKQILSDSSCGIWPVYVKHKSNDYTSDYVMLSNFDKSTLYFAGGRYNYKIRVGIADEISTPHVAYFELRIVDKDNNILSSSRSFIWFEDGYRVGDLSGSITYPQLSDDESESERNVILQVLVKNDNDDYSLLTPQDSSVNNPDTLTLYYRNNYDCVVISSDLISDTDKYSQGESFELTIPLLWSGGNHGAAAMIGTAIVYIKDEQDNVTEVGRNLAVAVAASGANNQVECQIPESMTAGYYELFTQFCYSEQANGPVRPKILGATENIIDSFTINIE